jgi:hypothetical protein
MVGKENVLGMSMQRMRGIIENVRLPILHDVKKSAVFDVSYCFANPEEQQKEFSVQILQQKGHHQKYRVAAEMSLV